MQRFGLGPCKREARAAQGSVMEFAGKYRSRLEDLAENHDAYLSDGW